MGTAVNGEYIGSSPISGVLTSFLSTISLNHFQENLRMLHISKKIPQKVILACSGGIDSMVVLDFLNHFPKRDIEIIHINHGTDHGKVAEEFVSEVCFEKKLKMHLYKINSDKPKKESWEEFWRNERYKYFHSFNLPVITAHHLNDVVEFYILSCLRGNGKLMNDENQNVIRPFLLTPKSEFLNWSERKGVKFVQDESNFENVHDRNIVRNEMMNTILKINPGIEKTVKKMLLRKNAHP